MKYICVAILVVISLAAEGQQLIQWSQRNTEMLTYNPAVAGSNLTQEIQLHNRMQWVGWDDAPIVQTISYNGAVGKNNGLGLYMLYDQTGPVKRYGGTLSYAYHIAFPLFNLSFGVSGSLKQYCFDINKLEFESQSHGVVEPLALSGDIQSKVAPDASTGIYASNHKFYFGFSFTELINSKLKTSSYRINQGQQYVVMTGYNFREHTQLVITPSFLLTSATGTPVQLDAGIRFEYNKMFLFGMSYRIKDAVVLLAGTKLPGNFFVAYSYDIVYSPVHKYNMGSHELVLFYVFWSKIGKSSYHNEDFRGQLLPRWK